VHSNEVPVKRFWYGLQETRSPDGDMDRVRKNMEIHGGFFYHITAKESRIERTEQPAASFGSNCGKAAR